MPLTFGQRKGLKPIKDEIQTNGMDLDLRNAIWNTLLAYVWYAPGFLFSGAQKGRIIQFSEALWDQFFHERTDTIPGFPPAIVDVIRDYYFNHEWFEVYELLEFVVNYFKNRTLEMVLNTTLERELSGYRFIGGVLTDITNAQEIEMLDNALADSDFPGVQAHLKRALELMSDRKNPDYRNSIKESISAVESLVKALTGLHNASLGDALKQAEISENIHPALKDAFIKLYGYTSNEQGIRHSMLDEPNLSAADARYFLLSCSAFVNYLKAKFGKNA